MLHDSSEASARSGVKDGSATLRRSRRGCARAREYRGHVEHSATPACEFDAGGGDGEAAESQPIHLRPSFSATTIVVPEPQKKSATRSPSLDEAQIIRSRDRSVAGRRSRRTASPSPDAGAGAERGGRERAVPGTSISRAAQPAIEKALARRRSLFISHFGVIPGNGRRIIKSPTA